MTCEEWIGVSSRLQNEDFPKVLSEVICTCNVGLICLILIACLPALARGPQAVGVVRHEPLSIAICCETEQ